MRLELKKKNQFLYPCIPPIPHTFLEFTKKIVNCFFEFCNDFTVLNFLQLICFFEKNLKDRLSIYFKIKGSHFDSKSKARRKKMLIKNTRTMAQAHGIKSILYGESGVGKTSQAKTLIDEGFKPIIISAESGLLSLAGSNIDVIDISRDDKNQILPPEKRFERLAEAYNFLLNQKHDYDTIILDSLTEINQCLMDNLRAKYPDSKDTLKMYGDNAVVMQKMIKKFRDLNYNVVLIALSSNEKDEVGRRFTTMDLVGKVAAGIPALFDTVLYMFVDENLERKILTSKTDKTTAKDRSGRLNQLEEPNLGKIFKKIKETKNV